MRLLASGSARVRYLAGLLCVLLGLGVYLAPNASAFIFVTPAPSFPDTVTVGQTFPAALGINNSSTPPESTANPVLTISAIDLYPACTTTAVDCSGGTAEGGVFAVSGTGTGTSIGAGVVGCDGTWTIVPDTGNPNTATRYRFIPPNGEGTLQLPTGTTCVVTYTAQALRVPTVDVNPALPNVQTNQVASSTATGPTIAPPGVRNSGTDQTTVLKAAPGVVTTAASTPAQPPPGGAPPPVPGTTTDSATITPPPPPSGAFGAPPTGTMTFNLFGPFPAGVAPTCGGAPFATQQVPVNGPGPYTTPTPVNITSPGTYTWVATYSGDANYTGASTACGDPAETVTFAAAAPQIVTQATPTITIGSTAQDTATLSGGFNPTGTITFTAFGPNNPTCSGAAVYTSAPVPVNGNGTYTSTPPFTPPAPGSYNWVASYSGDVNNTPAVSTCGAANETTVVNQGTATITTSATPTVTVGSPIQDTATVTGSPAPAPAPTGTVTFTLFNNATCTGAPVFTSAARPLSGGPPPTATSAPFTTTAPGTFNWIASYSGDANYAPVTSACLAPNEASVVNQATAAITTQATPTATIGSPISDTATVTGSPATAPTPTGTVTFTLFNNATCTGAPIFNSGPQPLTPGVQPTATATSGNFTPTAPGSYNWVAAYSGDANYPAVTSACGAPNETSAITQATAAITTNATSTATIGSPVSDTATVTGSPATAPTPTGTVTFTLFNNATCTGAPVFNSGARPLTPGAQPTATATSGNFTPTAPGAYNWVAAYSGDANYAAVTSACGAPNETSTITQAPVAISTQATQTATIGSPIQDVATVTGGAAPAPAPTGTVTFTLFNNATCTGAPIFTSANRPLAGGPPPTATSDPFTPTAPGTYNWIAAYSGDANYPPVTSACQAPNETSTVGQATAAITTQATPTATLGQPISDTATVTGTPATAPPPTGTVTFTLFNNATCTGAPVFTSPAVPLAGGPPPTASSGNFTPTAPGTYNWVAAYSGDANYAAVTSACGAPNETSTVGQQPTQIVTQAAGPVTLTQPISDTATLSGGQNPTGTITFTLFGPNNPGCTGAPIFTATVPVTGNGTYQSGPFTPTAPGTYNWVAVYSGDANNGGATSPCGAPNEASVVTTVPTIGIVKTATPPSRPAPGGDFTFGVTVTNTSTEVLTIRSLVDNVYGDLTTRPNSTCTTAIGTVLQPGGTYTCQFTAPFTGAPNASQTDTVTVHATNPSGVDVTASANATVTLTPITPTIAVQKSATPLSRQAPGGDFTFTVVVTNTTNPPEPVTITSLVDNVYGDLTTRPNSTCNTAIGTVLQPGASYTCTFTGPFTGNPGASQTDTVTATAVDQFGNQAQASAQATVNLTGVTPVIAVQKSANPLSRQAPGGDFTYTVVVTNQSNEPVTITSLTDNVYGNLTTRPNSTCTTAIGTVLQPGASYTCQFTAPFTGNPGASQTDTVTAVAVDQFGQQAQAQAQATVTLTGVTPVIAVQKSANPLTRQAPGGDFTFTVVVTNQSNEPVTITSLTDNVYGDLTTRANSTCTTAIGTVLQPGASYTCQFTAPFTGNPGATQTDTVTARAVDQFGQQAQAQAQATVALTNVTPQIVVVKNATPASRPVPGGDFTFTVQVINNGPEPVTITSLTDNVYGDLSTRGTCTTAVGTVLQPGGSYTCQFTAPFTGGPGASQTDTVTAVARDQFGNTVQAQAQATVFLTNVQPTISVTKTPNPTSRPEPGGDFTFTVVVGNTGVNAVTLTSLVDNVYGDLTTRANSTCNTAIGTVLQPGQTYTCQFTAPFTGTGGQSQTDTVTATGRDQFGNTAQAQAQATVTLTPVTPVISVVKTASPTSLPAPGGAFTFNVVVTNGSTTPVTITSLVDNIYGDLTTRPGSTCNTAIGTVLQPGGTYSCQFTGNFTGAGGASQTDTVTATAVSPSGKTAQAQAQATVTLTAVPPTVTVQKTADPTSKPAPGGDFTFSVVVTNTSPEPVRITSLVDNVYGDLSTKGSCTTAIGTVLPPNGTYQCSFTGRFTGQGGASQTDTVTVTVVNPAGLTAQAQASATVVLTSVPPTVTVQKSADPTSRPVPGGTFTFTVVVTNTSNQTVTLTQLFDNVYGNLDGKGTCKLGGTLAPAPGPGNTYTCQFQGTFTSDVGASQTDTVTATVTNPAGQTATAQAQATVTVTPPPPPAPPPPPVPQQPLPRTGGNLRGPSEIAAIFVTIGFLMVGAAWRTQSAYALVGVPGGPVPPDPTDRPGPATRRWRRRRSHRDDPPEDGFISFSGLRPHGGGGGGIGWTGGSGAALAVPRANPSVAGLASGLGLSAGCGVSAPSPAPRSRQAGAGLVLFGSPVLPPPRTP